MAWDTDLPDRTAPAGSVVRNNLSATVESIWSAIENLEQKLGVGARGGLATVAARLDAMQAEIDAIDPSGVVDAAIDSHVDASDPHTGKYGKIVTPNQTDGGGRLEVGTSPSASGPDYVAWIDT